MATQKQIKYWESMKGKPKTPHNKHWKLTEETKRKISLAKKGVKLSESHRKNMIGKVGIYKRTTKIKQKYKEARLRNPVKYWLNKKRISISGSNHYKWKTNRDELRVSEKKHLDTKYRYWMMEVKNRDKWLCKISNGDCRGRLESHHILSWQDYPELRYEINNGITLCLAHHPRSRKKEAELSPYFQKLVAEMK